MRLFGHPIHVMLVHFPVALWPAHGVLHLFSAQLPAGVSAVAGFWLLATGTALGWLAAFFGASDLLALARDPASEKFRHAIVHAVVNGTVLASFTVIFAFEFAHYPAVAHGAGFLTLEAALVVAMLAGNYFGAAVIWGKR